MANVGQVQINIDEHYKQCVMALQRIAQLADTGSQAHKEQFQPNGEGDGIANGWRVAEAMREIANDTVGYMQLTRPRFAKGDRVLVLAGVRAWQIGTISHVVGGREADYYGVMFDGITNEVMYENTELQYADQSEPAWVSRFANGNADCSPFIAQQIAFEVRELLIYKAAMESMAAQFIHPKTTAMELAKSQLGLK